MTNLMTSERNDIPRVKGSPVIGILPNLLNGDPYEYLKNVMLEYGDLVALNIGPQTVYLASHPDYLQRILRDNHENYCKPSMFYSGVKRVTGNGLVTSSGEFWLRQRRMIQPHLHRKALGTLFEEMVNSIDEVLENWYSRARSRREFRFDEAMSEITINVIMRTMMGKDLLTRDDIESSISEMTTIIRYIGSSQFLGFLPEWFPLPDQKQFDQAIASFKAKVRKIIHLSRTRKDESASLISMLLGTVDEVTNEQMTEDQLFDEVITIFAAGYETTATALMWVWTLLDQHPDVQTKLFEEVDSVLGSRLPTFEDVMNLRYTRQVFLETMRLKTVAPMLPRQLVEADTLGDYQLPANATVLMFYHGVHHNPAVWDDPEAFRPERFANERTADRHAFAYVPFSAGPRKCAGDEFAMLEGTLAIAMVLQRYAVHLTPGQDFSSKVGATMRPRNGVLASLALRTPSALPAEPTLLAAD